MERDAIVQALLDHIGNKARDRQSQLLMQEVTRRGRREQLVTGQQIQQRPAANNGDWRQRITLARSAVTWGTSGLKRKVEGQRRVHVAAANTSAKPPGKD